MRGYKAARIASEMTIQDVAKRLNITPATLSFWESGKTEPRMSDLKKMSEIYGVPLETLFDDEVNITIES